MDAFKDRVAVITGSGGSAVWMSDILSAHGRLELDKNIFVRKIENIRLAQRDSQLMTHRERERTIAPSAEHRQFAKHFCHGCAPT